MRSRIRIAVLSLSCLAVGVTGWTAEPPKPQIAEQVSSGDAGDAGMEAMMKAAQPGEQHKTLARMVGDWTFTQKAWMAPGQKPAESKGTMHAESRMDGRYVEHAWKGDFMGRPFEGRGTDGYDNVSKQYVSSWIDNMGTGIMTSTGTCDDGGKKCTYNAAFSDPMTGAPGTMRSVITWADNDHFTNEMYGKDPASGQEVKMMELTVTRKKK
jgi:hypothetical protein